jgi:hypothetical protein
MANRGCPAWRSRRKKVEQGLAFQQGDTVVYITSTMPPEEFNLVVQSLTP